MKIITELESKVHFTVASPEIAHDSMENILNKLGNLHYSKDTLVSPIDSIHIPAKKSSSKRRKSRTCHELANTTTSLREIAKNITNTPITFDSPPKTVMIVTKIFDVELIKLTKKVTEWLINEMNFTVLIEDQLKTHEQFDYEDLLERISGNDTASSESSFYNSDSDESIDTPPLTKSFKSSNKLSFWNQEYCDSTESREEIDFIISFGGDGTVLHSAWLFQQHKGNQRIPPIVPFNLGSLGFLTVFDFADNFKEIIGRLVR